MKCVLLVFVALGYFASATLAQKPTPKPSPVLASTDPTPKPTPERPREIVALLNDARLAAPELTIEAFLRVLETKKVTDPIWRKEILDEALRLIDDVPRAMPVELAIARSKDLHFTEQFIQRTVSNLKYDRLSFRSRLISLLTESEPQRARQIIFQIGGELGLKPRTCEDVLTFLPNDIYAAVVKVGKTAFTPQQVAEGQRALFLLPWIENIESPTQIWPALEILKEMQGSPAERQMLFNAFSAAIDRNFKDDRSFTSSQGWSIGARISKLVAGDPDPQKSALVAAFRSMLLKNLRASRCSDNAIEKGNPLPEYIVEANKVFSESPLKVEDVVTADKGGTYKLTSTLQKSHAAQKLFDEAAVIARTATTVVDGKYAKHDPKDQDWISQLNAFFDKLIGFEGTEGETEAELLWFKSTFMSDFSNIALDPGDLRRAVTRKNLQFIVGSPIQRKDFGQWLLQLKMVEISAPEDFTELAPEFPNQNIKVLLAMRKLGIADDRKGN